MKIEIIDVTLETELGNFIYESDIIPRKGDIVSVGEHTYLITDIIHNVNSDVKVTLLSTPAIIKYSDYLH